MSLCAQVPACEGRIPLTKLVCAVTWSGSWSSMPPMVCLRDVERVAPCLAQVVLRRIMMVLQAHSNDSWFTADAH